MGSHKDLDFCKKIIEFIKRFNVEVETRIASAHKTPLKVIKILEENKEYELVYITVAGRSNAISAFIDANCTQPVIACPPLSKDKFDTDVFSSISMPSGVCPLFCADPENAALAALKILALQSKELKKKIESFQDEQKKLIDEKDKGVKNG